MIVAQETGRSHRQDGIEDVSKADEQDRCQRSEDVKLSDRLHKDDESK